MNKQGKIFERFYQVESQHIGSGIGLSLVQRLVELHHGHIELESEEGSMQRQVADAGETPEESMLREEQKSEILQALESLSPEHKVAVILRDIKGLSYEEIAEILELTLGTVKSRISRGRNQLKQEILKLREQDAHFIRHKRGKEGRQ